MIQDKLRELQQWSLWGCCHTELPAADHLNDEGAQLQLMRYCYYRLIYHLAGRIIDEPRFESSEHIDTLLLCPFGPCVSLQETEAFGGFVLDSDLRQYCGIEFFPNCYTASDVAGCMSSSNALESLLEAAVEDKKNFQ